MTLIDTYNSPQGDGNKNSSSDNEIIGSAFSAIDTYNSPQGDGNIPHLQKREPIRLAPDRYLQFPARGRKRVCNGATGPNNETIDTYNSPQGDGNAG